MVFIIACSILFLDRITKSLVTTNLSLNQSQQIIKGIFHLTLIHNRGAAFGILKDQTPLFIITSISAVILICLSLKTRENRKFSIYPVRNIASAKGDGKISNGVYSLSLAFILGGALGNLIDRVSLGYVVDFLDFRIWPVFNIADSAITVGAVLLGYCILCKK